MEFDEYLQFCIFGIVLAVSGTNDLLWRRLSGNELRILVINLIIQAVFLSIAGISNV